MLMKSKLLVVDRNPKAAPVTFRPERDGALHCRFENWSLRPSWVMQELNFEEIETVSGGPET
jgi:predicted Rdx family selenoprotein